jgi:transcriptional regulator with XRE-family HTH domain
MKLGEYLKKHGISMQAFADKVELSCASISRYITGERYPQRQHAVRIVNATGGTVSFDDLYTDPPAKKRKRRK